LEDPTTQLFRLALGVVPPWRVEEINFEAERQRLDIRLGFARGSRFP
jgi:hypothetical protein